MIRVSPAEHSLLTLARTVVGSGRHGPVEDLLRERHAVPERLGPNALRVLRDTLAKGVVLALVRRGGWRRQRHLHPGREASGRLWQRHPPPALRFSPLCVKTLQWLTAQPLDTPGCEPLAAEGAPTLADELFLYLCCHLVAGTPYGSTVGAQAPFQRSALCWLGFPELLGTPPPDFGAARFAPLLAERGLALEALQEDLAHRWLQLEQSKGRLAAPAALVALGTAQERVLSAFLDAVDAAERRDLAGFLLEAARPLVEQPASRWVGRLSPEAPLRERSEATQAAGAFLRALGRLERW
jgi:hypothetical protein